MSFKREGDNEELLNNLKDQRVRGLLSSYIPEEEAKLLSNGRLTCLICQHRPIFDNVTILSVHRRGRRHLNELSRYLKCKQEYNMKQIKAKQLKELQQSTSVTESEHSLVIDQETGIYPLPLSRRTFIQAISLGSGGKKCQILKKSGHKNDRKMFLEIPSTEVKLKSYKLTNPNKPSASSAVRNYLKSLPRKTSIEKVIEECRDNYGSTSNNHCDYRREVTSPQCCETTEVAHTLMVPGKQTSTPTLEEKAVQHELHLRMSGWIKDVYGNWMKDPEVEFDSDEDSVPPSPPPP